MWKCAVILAGALALLSPIVAAAQPQVQTVSGSAANGQELTVTGLNFGAKSAPTALHFDDFEGGSSGSLLGSEGYWTLYSDNLPASKPSYSTDHPRSARSAKAGKFPLWGTEGEPGQSAGWGQDHIIKSGLDFSAGPSYLDYWVYFNQPSTTSTHQIKLARLSAGSADNFNYPQYFLDNWTYEGGSRATYLEIRANPGTCNTSGAVAYNSDLANGVWSHVQIEFNPGTRDQPNATSKIYINGNHVATANGFMVYCAGSPGLQGVWIGGYIGNNTTAMNTTIYYDDVYFDNSYQRVELGNAATYAACTHRETQLPVSWQNGSVTFRVNQGSFQTTESVYLYVLDANGAPNATGKLVAWGTATGGPGQPGKPQVN